MVSVPGKNASVVTEFDATIIAKNELLVIILSKSIINQLSVTERNERTIRITKCSDKNKA